MEDIVSFFKEPEVFEALAGVVTEAIAFLIFFWIMKRFAWKPVIRILDDRRRKIENEFEKVDALEKKFLELQAEYEGKLGSIERRGREEIRNAIIEGKRLAQGIIDSAHEQSKMIIARGKTHVDLEFARARKMLQEDVIEMVIQISEKFLKTKIDDREQRELVASFVDEIEKKI